jgi:hypothetical protein
MIMIIIVVFAIEDVSVDVTATSPPMTHPESLQRTEVSATDLIPITTAPVLSESIVPAPVYDYVTRVDVRQTSQ